MAHSDITAFVLATEDNPMAPLFGSNLIVQGKRILVSALGANFDRVYVMTFEEIEAATQFNPFFA